jgi:hypothetical protein
MAVEDDEDEEDNGKKGIELCCSYNETVVVPV